MEYCTTEQQQERLNVCKECEMFSFKEDGITYCATSNLDINLVTTNLDSVCPKEKW